jgi:hypothetical protein
MKVTESAKQQLKGMLSAAQVEQCEGLRFLPKADGTFMIVPSEELTGDQVVEYHGSKVLLVGMEYLRLLEDKTMDCCKTDYGNILLVK